MLNLKTQSLVEDFQPIKIKKELLHGQGITVSRTVSAAAVIYEAARNAVEFRAEHLIRRASIERILKRRLLTKSNGEGIAESLVRELLWARYLENGEIPNTKIEEIQKTIIKYINFKNESLKNFPPSEKNKIIDWIFGIASCEIEKKLSPAPNREALTNFVYQSLKDSISIEGEKEKKNQYMQVYIAVQRAYAQGDDPIIRYQLFLSFFPDWMVSSPEISDEVLKKFPDVYREIEKQLSYPLRDKIKQLVKKESAPFYVIRDLAEEFPNEFQKIISDPIQVEEYSRAILSKRYLEIRDRLRRAATRSIIYIFLTKMIIALILELPFDLILKKTNYLALTINTIFPPALMFLVTAAISLPDEQNTEKVVEKIKYYLFESRNREDTFIISKPKPTSLVFTLVYFLTYIFIFGAIIAILNALGFNIISKMIFIFFLTVVSFFGYRVRLSTKDYVIKEKESTIAPVIDFLFIPILRVGQWLSGEIAQFNFLIFLLDFIIEAPFKAFFLVIEEWIHFLRTKKEEIII